MYRGRRGGSPPSIGTIAMDGGEGTEKSTADSLPGERRLGPLSWRGSMRLREEPWLDIQKMLYGTNPIGGLCYPWVDRQHTYVGVQDRYLSPHVDRSIAVHVKNTHTHTHTQ